MQKSGKSERQTTPPDGRISVVHHMRLITGTNHMITTFCQCVKCKWPQFGEKIDSTGEGENEEKRKSRAERKRISRSRGQGRPSSPPHITNTFPDLILCYKKLNHAMDSRGSRHMEMIWKQRCVIPLFHQR